VKELLTSPAVDLAAQDKRGLSALHFCYLVGSREILECLLQHVRLVYLGFLRASLA
jgi:ankyrin repeat protein